MGSLYSHFQGLRDSRKPRGLRYRLDTVLVMMVMAKLCGEDRPSGMADWVKHHGEQFVEMLKLPRRTMPHHSTYRRIMEDGIDVEELEQVVSQVLSGRKYHGKQVLLSIEGKGCEIVGAAKLLKMVDLCNGQQWVEHFLNHGDTKPLRKIRAKLRVSVAQW